MVLLVVDTQKAIMTGELYQFELLCSNIKALIHKARQNGTEVLFVRHDGGDGDELAKGSEGFEIFDDFRPADGELVFDKTVSSSFKNTGLLEYLRGKGEDTVIIVGLQTDYCIDATVQAGFEHGFKMIIPSNANSTFDNEYMSAEQSYRYYNEFMWGQKFAHCIPFEEALALISR